MGVPELPVNISNEPTLTFTLSDDEHVFRCSMCHRAIASVGRADYIVVMGVIELIATFQEHVRRYPPKAKTA
jgi:hypothetical protein